MSRTSFFSVAESKTKKERERDLAFIQKREEERETARMTE
jgi:hypothetical protein